MDFNGTSTNDNYESTFVYLIRKNGKLSVQVDKHKMGVFKLSMWSKLLKEVGFKVKQYDGYKIGKYVLPMFVGTK